MHTDAQLKKVNKMLVGFSKRMPKQEATTYSSFFLISILRCFIRRLPAQTSREPISLLQNQGGDRSKQSDHPGPDYAQVWPAHEQHHYKSDEHKQRKLKQMNVRFNHS